MGGREGRKERREKEDRRQVREGNMVSCLYDV